jgi:hypothetical protein
LEEVIVLLRYSKLKSNLKFTDYFFIFLAGEVSLDLATQDPLGMKLEIN